MAESSPTMAATAADTTSDDAQSAEADAAGSAAAPAPVPAPAESDALAAERIAFLSLAAELAKGLNVLVVDGGGGSLGGIAAHLDSASLDELPDKAGAGYAMLVADLPADGGVAAQTIGAIAAVLDQSSGFALVRIPNTPANAALGDHLRGAFARSTDLRQANWIASALLADEVFASGDPSQAAAATLRKGSEATPGEELYTIILAAHGELPKIRPHLALSRSPELRELTDELARVRAAAAVAAATAEARAAAQDETIRELQAEIAWLDEHELNLRVKIEKRPWALGLAKAWARFVGLARRAKAKLRW